MKKLFIEKAIAFIKKYKNDYTDEEIEKMKYGLEGIYLTLYKTVVLIVLSLILGIFKEVVLLIVLFNIIRFTGFGFHAEKSYQCLIISTVEFVLLPYILLKLYIPMYLFYIISIFCISIYLLYAPADTIKRPLPNKRKRKIRKIATVIIGTLYLILIICIKNDVLAKLLLSALVLEAISINPLTYKIFNQPYRNYLNYSDV